MLTATLPGQDLPPEFSDLSARLSSLEDAKQINRMEI